MIDVLVTGAGALLGQGIIKALRSAPSVGRIVAADLSPTAVGLWVADRAYLLPRYDAPDYVGALAKIAAKERVHAILCGTDLEVGTLARARARLEHETGAKVVVSGVETVAIADDKWRTATFLRDHGFDAPRSALPDDAERLAGDVGFPLVVKPRFGAGSVGLSVVRDRDALGRSLGEGMVVQEYLGPDDQEFTCGTLVFEGTTRAATALRRTLRHGNTHTAEANGHDEVAAYAAEVAARLPDAHGPVNLQLRVTPRGPVVFEINARFSGTTPLRAELGYNEVEVVLRHLIEGVPVPPAQLRRGLVLRWTAEVVVPLESVETLRKDGTLDAPPGELVGTGKRE